MTPSKFLGALHAMTTAIPGVDHISMRLSRYGNSAVITCVTDEDVHRVAALFDITVGVIRYDGRRWLSGGGRVGAGDIGDIEIVIDGHHSTDLGPAPIDETRIDAAIAQAHEAVQS